MRTCLGTVFIGLLLWGTSAHAIDSFEGNIVKMPIERLSSWARSQGFQLVAPKPEYFSEGYVIRPPGVKFMVPLSTEEKGNRVQTGYALRLFPGNLVSPTRSQILASDFKYYENILRFEVIIEGISYGHFEMGYGQSLPVDIIIPIPFIRDISGPLPVEIKLNNHPANFLVWFGSVLVRND